MIILKIICIIHILYILCTEKLSCLSYFARYKLRYTRNTTKRENYNIAIITKGFKKQQ